MFCAFYFLRIFENSYFNIKVINSFQSHTSTEIQFLRAYTMLLEELAGCQKSYAALLEELAGCSKPYTALLEELTRCPKSYAVLQQEPIVYSKSYFVFIQVLAGCSKLYPEFMISVIKDIALNKRTQNY